MQIFLLTLFIVICLLLIVVVLLQKGRGGGLGGAFGGGMTSSAFGTRTGDVFTWVTIVLTSLFLLVALVDTVVFRQKPPELHAAFSPPSGPIEKETAVTISVPGAAKQEVKVYYTLDGMDPSDKSALYSKEAVKVLPGQTLKARVYRGDKGGPTVEAFYGRPDQYKEATPTPTTEGVEAQPATAPGRATSPASSSAPSGRPGIAPEASTAPKPASAPSGGPPPRSEVPRAATRPAPPAASSAAAASNPAP